LNAALTRLNAALATDPDLAQAYASRAEVYRLLERYPEAMDDIDIALSLKPDLAEAWRQKALLNRTLGHWEEALSAANELIRLKPDDASAYVLRAEIYAEGLHEPRLALKDYNWAIARDPDYKSMTLVERWNLYADLGRWRQAFYTSYQMFTTGSDDPLRYYYRGWSLIQLDRLDEAMNILLIGIRRYPDYPVALYYALGVAYFERHAWPQAIQALEVALLQSGAPLTQAGDTVAWQHLDISTADILAPLGRSYLKIGQCETGAAIVQRAAAESNVPQIEADPDDHAKQAEQAIEACYLALTPTPTATEVFQP
jgi:tetratricopeptide (TPR) repeat protein